MGENSHQSREGFASPTFMLTAWGAYLRADPEPVAALHVPLFERLEEPGRKGRRPVA